MMHGHVVKWVCPRACGWSRAWHDSPIFLDMIIDHPLLGAIPERTLVNHDIENHRCESFRQWREKKATLGWNEQPDYSVALYAAQAGKERKVA